MTASTGTIIVTGGLGTLGRAVVATLEARGHHVSVVDVAPSGPTPNDNVQGNVDLSEEAAVEAVFSKIATTTGGVKGLVNVAGGFLWETVADGSIDSWDRMYRINLRTAAITCRAVLPHLTGNQKAIVNVGAAAAIADVASGMAPYAASKAGIQVLTESLANELRGSAVRVNAILPTIIDTPANRSDMPDADTSAWVRPGAAAKVIAFLLSDEAAAISGETIRLSLAGAD